MRLALPTFAVFTTRWALILALPLGACNSLFGEEVARLPVNSVSTAGHNVEKEATLQLNKDEEITMWSDVAMAYEGNAQLRFEVAVLKDGVPYKQLALNPTEKNVTIGEVKTKVNDKVNWSFTGKNGNLKVPETGAYTFKARLVASHNPTLRVSRAELVLKK